MTDRTAAMAAWTQAGTDLIMLPSTVEVRLDIPSLPALMATGALPSTLRALALKFLGSEAEVELTDAEKEQAEDIERLLISQSIRAIKPPDMDETPFVLTPDDLKKDPCPVPRYDYLALRDIVLHIRTPLQVDAMSRVAVIAGELEDARNAGASDEEIAALETRLTEKSEWAARVVQNERVNTIEGWASFRSIARGIGDGAARATVGDAPVSIADHLGPGGRPRARRRARPAASDSSAGAEPAAKPKRRAARNSARDSRRPAPPPD